MDWFTDAFHAAATYFDGQSEKESLDGNGIILTLDFSQCDSRSNSLFSEVGILVVLWLHPGLDDGRCANLFRHGLHMD